MNGQERTYFISTGEFSGDIIASDLVIQLKKVLPELRGFGFGGERLKRSGIDIILSHDGLNVMGISEVIGKIDEIVCAEKFLLAKIDQYQPEFAILVDFPGFHLHLAEQLKQRGIRVIQYIAPKVWAWGPERVASIRKLFDLVLGILPFEESFFRENGVNYHYVGSPHFDKINKMRVSKNLFGIPNEDKLVCCLAGSRTGETKHIAPHLAKIVKSINIKNPQIKFVFPLAPSISAYEMSKSFGFNVPFSKAKQVLGGFLGYQVGNCFFIHGSSLELMGISDVCVVASGTATLECTLVGTPFVVIYAMDQLFYSIAQKKVKLKFISLPNLIMNRGVVSEHIQSIDANKITEEVLSLIGPGIRRDTMLLDLDEISKRLSGNAAESSAQLIAEYLRAFTSRRQG